jgi:hydroxymethylpyrimidine/phosphomethylpyrimidine kinase
MPVAAFKVAALGVADNVQAIAEILADYPDLPVVLDPYPAAARRSGAAGEAGDAEMASALRELLLPQTTVLTVSLSQARRLIAAASDDESAEELGALSCARRLLEWGAEHVLITGAETIGVHLVNRLFSDDGAVQNESIERIDLPFRGAGDTLSAAIAALLAQGIAPGDAVREANEYLGQSLTAGFRLGMGDAMPDRLFWATEEAPEIPAGERDE